MRASASPPSSCSGAMYWNVPRIVPRVVSGWLCWSAVGMLVACDTWLLSGSTSFARPKSSSFTPDFVSMTLPGLRSRWMIPLRCAASSAPAISIAMRSAWSIESAPLPSRSARVSPSRNSMTR